MIAEPAEAAALEYASRPERRAQGAALLWAAAGLCLPVVGVAWLAGLGSARPDLVSFFTVIPAVMMIALPCVVASVICWMLGLTFLARTRDIWGPRLRRGLVLAAVPPVLAAVSCALLTGVAAPALPPAPGLQEFAAAPVPWAIEAEWVRANLSVRAGDQYAMLRAARPVGGLPVEEAALDAGGGVWFRTRQRDAGGIWDYWIDGLVHRPTPGIDPFGNRGALTLVPLGNDWHAFRTRWSD